MKKSIIIRRMVADGVDYDTIAAKFGMYPSEIQKTVQQVDGRINKIPVETLQEWDRVTEWFRKHVEWVKRV